MTEQHRRAFSAEMEARVSAHVTDEHRRHGLPTPAFDQEFWEQRWDTVHSVGMAMTPNRTLTGVATQLQAGRALDAGCGEGTDALWLADRGWDVTAVDFVESALTRGRARADERGGDLVGRIDWRQADLSVWTPPAAAFDLVSAHYLHGITDRANLFRRLAAAVRPGGTLLIVGHHPSNADVLGVTMPGAVFFTTADLLAVLDDQWDLVTVDDDVPREMTDLEGRPRRLRSALVQALRRQ
ncbi:class I SAM-dependent methyltransferase [Mycobacterium sp. 21AC1]|uniref:class I SAM-dependent methyltransferase n=1 Tax=[Mycobacterium] appelbergii TaxID=2939269 RepID=UPI002939054D|nr:class I SAM-dependent methyltransferase [Mycobacterium sp. 21AC1]MDV3123421.1 class I SAM-dependent methyltransferase [Mycobacterium sp. 21AC1]